MQVTHVNSRQTQLIAEVDGALEQLLPDPVEILEYIDLVRQELSSFLDATNLEGESGFHWLPFNKLELQFYNIRHIQQHAGELCERLFAETGIEIDWVIWHPDA